MRLLAKQKRFAAGVLRFAPAARGAAAIVSGQLIAIEAAVVAVLETAKKVNSHGYHWHIQEGGDEYHGEIHTLDVQAKNVRITPNAQSNPEAPSHRVFVGRAEIGAIWPKRSEKGTDYHSAKLDDPSSNAPIYANLVADPESEGMYNMIWSRPNGKNGD